ncbi:carbohydrate ABC transporter permease [Merismopedia glauca]|uniref:ABC transporter permease n=1 Tax=Merismopedia glauca CCAP 1448/3 TaxID=1296344 RepID=A0A2T1C5N9_9CYAN|nr:carbohydrate ABC transporter permease [Merismopedia glauca]PSB03468.1 ABC transporter permease [Merismopedia glauca CCAP 1448/3]
MEFFSLTLYRKKSCCKIGLYILLLGYAIATLFPFLWAMSSSFKTLSEIVSGNSGLIPQHFTWDNYKKIIWEEPLFLRWLFNSIFVASWVTGLNLICNSLAGYALARVSFVGNKFLFWIVLAILMIPGQITLIPSYLILKNLGWLNTYQGLIIPNGVNATFIFMMRQFFINFPTELEEAASLDGLGVWETFWKIVLPLAKPALAAQTIFIFMGSWNNFLMPLVVVSQPDLFTLPLGLNTFRGEYISYWNYIMAASIVFTLPVLSIYAVFNRYFIEGVKFTGSK